MFKSKSLGQGFPCRCIFFLPHAYLLGTGGFISTLLAGHHILQGNVSSQ